VPTVIETSKTVLGEEHPNTLGSMRNLAWTYINQERWAEAKQLYVQVIETSKTVLGHEHPNTLLRMGYLAWTYINQERWAEAEQLLLQIIETTQNMPGRNQIDILRGATFLARNDSASPDRVRPSPVQSSPSNFWSGIGPIPTFSGPGLHCPGLIWISPAQCPGLGYFFTVSVF